MNKKLFLSYSSKDRRIAVALQKALRRLKWDVWRDEASIAAGDNWSAAIDTNLRDAAAVVVLITPASLASAWVTYEYAFATGAKIPVVAVRVGDGAAPDPIRRFQVVPYGRAGGAERVHAGILKQIELVTRQAESDRERRPALVAKFWADKDGRLYWHSEKKVAEIRMELWVADAPSQTSEVAFEVLADVDEREWTRKRKKRPGPRPFLTDDVNLYGDVEIIAHGREADGAEWRTESRLYDALVRYYQGRPLNAEIRNALNQIRDN